MYRLHLFPWNRITFKKHPYYTFTKIAINELKNHLFRTFIHIQSLIELSCRIHNTLKNRTIDPVTPEPQSQLTEQAL